MAYNPEMTYKEWREWTLSACKQSDIHWAEVDGWLYPTHKNRTFFGVVHHLCQGNKDNTDAVYRLDSCPTCGVETPAGIKMLALFARL